jgi:hypothetical protein
MLPDTLEGNAGVGLTRDSIRNMDSAEPGYYSWQFQRMHGDLDNANLHIERFENLQQEFISIMQAPDVEQVDAMQAKFDSTPR